MSHTTRELIKSFSVETSFNKCDRERSGVAYNQEFDNRDIGEHIYENVEHIAKIKQSSLSGFVSSLKSRTRDLRFKKLAKKLKPKMKGIAVLKGKEKQSTSFSESLADDEDSYTSCLEENIYENLNFNFLSYWNEDEIISENDSLKDWLLHLTTTVDDYDESEIMLTKCVPGKHKNIINNFNESPINGKRTTPYTLQLDQYKLDILNKCFAAIWRQESEDEILNNLYVFLNDIFSSYFIRNAKLHHQETEATQMISLRTPSTEKRRKRPKKIYGTVMCKKTDKKAIQKLETFILSVTLNRLTITYDKCMKFYFTLETPQTRWLFAGTELEVFNRCRPFLIKNYQRYELKQQEEVKEFLKVLKLILRKRFLEEDLKNRKNIIKKFDETVNREQVIAKEENIYQPIWKWHTDCKNVIRGNNIYTPLDFIIELDEQDWEIDSEFSFVDSRNAISTLERSMYDSICILYSNENPDLNKIIYSYKPSSLNVQTLRNATRDNTSERSQSQSQGAPVSHLEKVPSNYDKFDSVEAWKKLLRDPCYLEDEEDVIMSESQIESLILIPPQMAELSLANEDSTSNNHDGPPKTKIIPISNGSYELKTSANDIPAIETSLAGNYRQMTENDSITGSETSVDLIEEPKKEREKFRDKFRGFKLKSSKVVAVNQENVEAAKEVEEEFFGSNLETVEKDLEHKHVPRIVVECIAALETESNLKTPGLYRVSGNKTIIEAFKKKNSDKKASKKDSKYASLKNQDVHSVTGILKMFFRELMPPLMPSSFFLQCTSDGATLEHIYSVLKEMPACNYQTLKFLMAHLKRVEQEQEENLMNSSNLAICFGLCIFSNSFDATNQFFENDISKCNMLCKKMIDHYNVIFKD